MLLVIKSQAKHLGKAFPFSVNLTNVNDDRIRELATAQAGIEVRAMIGSTGKDEVLTEEMIQERIEKIDGKSIEYGAIASTIGKSSRTRTVTRELTLEEMCVKLGITSAQLEKMQKTTK